MSGGDYGDLQWEDATRDANLNGPPESFPQDVRRLAVGHGHLEGYPGFADGYHDVTQSRPEVVRELRLEGPESFVALVVVSGLYIT